MPTLPPARGCAALHPGLYSIGGNRARGGMQWNPGRGGARRNPRRPRRRRDVGPAVPAATLLLLTATGQAAHGGGKRMDVGSPEYELLRRWIAAGARLDDPERSRLTRLEVTPAEQTARPGERYRLRVQAAFADGSAED